MEFGRALPGRDSASRKQPRSVAETRASVFATARSRDHRKHALVPSGGSPAHLYVLSIPYFALEVDAPSPKRKENRVQILKNSRKNGENN